jgi:hypothetical protein
VRGYCDIERICLISIPHPSNLAEGLAALTETVFTRLFENGAKLGGARKITVAKFSKGFPDERYRASVFSNDIPS